VPQSPDDRRAKDCLADFKPRRVAGEGLLDRVVMRAKKGPRWARVFDRLGLPDPYDCDAEEQPLGLGPVGIKLVDRRRPAPHARPPQDKESKSNLSKPQQPQQPQQPQGRPKPVRLAQPPKPVPPKAPDLAEPPAPLANVDANPGDPIQPGEVVPVRSRELPPIVPGPNVPRPKSRFGRVRLSPRADTSGPRIKEIKPQVDVLGADSVEQAVSEEPEVRRAPPGPDMGLDDLFGFSGGGGRLRTPKKGKDKG
jgi:hypothetical protein